MIAPWSLQLASIMDSPQRGAALYEFDGQVMWLPTLCKNGDCGAFARKAGYCQPHYFAVNHVKNSKGIT